MAYTGYGAKYSLTFSDVFQNTTAQYVATIYRKGYSGDIVELDGNASPLVIETDRDGGNGGYRPVVATKASLNLVINDVRVDDEWTDNTNIWELYNLILTYTGFDFTEFLTADPDTFLLEVKKKNGASYDIIWQGYYVYNTDVSLTEIMPIQFSLQFSDVLQMKNNRFYNFLPEDTNPIKYYPSDKISLLEAIMKCCYFSYITDKVIIEDPMIPDVDTPYSGNRYKKLVSGFVFTGNTLDTIYVQKNCFLDELGKYKTLVEVLEGICSQFGLIAYFKDNKLHIKKYGSLVNSNSRYVRQYTINSYNSGTDVVTYTADGASYTETDTVVALNSSTFRNIGRSQVIRFNYPIKDIILSNTASLNTNTPNHTMSSISRFYYNTTQYDYVFNSWYNKVGTDLVEAIVGPDDVQNPLNPRPFSPYALYQTSDPLDHFATRLTGTGNTPGFSLTNFIDSEMFSVEPGDTFAFSYSAILDGRFKGLSAGDKIAYRPKVVIALVLIANDENGDETEYFYNSSINLFQSSNIPTGSGSLPLQITTDYNGTDAERIHYDLKAVLNIPKSAKLKIRHYAPWRTSANAAPTDAMQIFVEYCNLQTFKGSPISGLPTKQDYKTSYNSLLYSDENFTLDSGLMMMDSTQYVPDGIGVQDGIRLKNPMFVSLSFGNDVFDEFNSPASFLFLAYDNPDCFNISYATLKGFLQNANEELLKNLGLNHCVIEGQFKSKADYFIGSKFSYQIIGYDSVNFAMLDYSIDLKNGTYDPILYSSEFMDSTGKVVASKTLIS